MGERTMTKRAKRKTGTALAVQQPRRPRTGLELIVAASTDPRVKPEKLRELIAMQREFEDRQAARAFNEAMVRAKAEIPVVVKDSANEQTNSRYAKLEKVSRVIDPIIHRHGLALTYGMADSPLPEHYRVTCRVRHELGHVEDHFLDLPADAVGIKGNVNKTKVHGVASTVTYCRRILKCLVFDVNVADSALPDDDGNAAGGSLALGEREVELLIEKIEEAGVDKTKFCVAFGIEGVAKLPPAKFREALDRVAQYKASHAPRREPAAEGRLL